MRRNISVCLCFLVLLWATESLGATVGNGAECGGTTGDTCDTAKDLQCNVIFAGCDTHGLCGCASTHEYDGVDAVCKKMVGNQGDCTDTATTMCKGTLTCTNNKCVCDGTYDSNHPTLCLATGEYKVGANCTGTDGNDNNTLCQSGTCSSLVCACPAGQRDYNGYCASPNHGDTCTSGTDTCQPTASVDCAGGATKCKCTDQTEIAYSVPSDLLGCRANGNVTEGNACSATADCQGAAFYCVKCGTSDADTCRKAKSGAVTIKMGFLAIGMMLFSSILV